MNKVTCIHLPKSKKSKFVIIYNMHKWPDRVLKHRGWTGKHIVFERPATDIELVEIENSNREIAYRYNSIEELIFDEISVKALSDEKQISDLRQKLKQLEPTL